MFVMRRRFSFVAFARTQQEILDDNPHVLGAIRWKGDLPFLFKVISISKALSIQAHPDKVCPVQQYQYQYHTRYKHYTCHIQLI